MTVSDSAPDWDEIPLDLRACAQWVPWHYYGSRDSKRTKIPLKASDPSKRASTTDPATWGPFEQALDAVKREVADGVGFVVTADDDFAGLDIDNCRNPDTGELSELAARAVTALHSYVEVTPSGRGIRIWVRAPGVSFPRKKFPALDIELYTEARYFTVTGQPIGDAREICERGSELTEFWRNVEIQAGDVALLSRARAASNGKKFSRLYDRGEHEYGSESEADLALCGMLAFWTKGDRDAIDRVFRRSALMREKWDRDDYASRTLDTAIDGLGADRPSFALTGFSAEDFESAVAERLLSLRVSQEAQARLHATEFAPPALATTFAEVLALPEPQISWTVEQLAEHGHNVLLAAQFKAGKTTLLLNLVRAMVDDVPFLGRFNCQLEGRACYLNCELTEADAQRWIKDLQFANPERALLVGLRGQPNPLASVQGQRWLVDFLKRHNVSTLIVDTFRASYFGDSHNDNAQVARYTALLDSVKAEANVSMLVLSHHFGRKEHEPGQEHGQGAVELDNWADMRWLLTLGGDSRFLAATGRTDGIPESRLNFDRATRRLVLDESSFGLGREHARKHSAEEAILNVVRANPGVTARELRTKARGKGVSTEACDQALKALVAGRTIVTHPGPNNSKQHYLLEDAPGQTTLDGGE